MVVVRVMLASQSSRKRGASHIPVGTIHGWSKTARVTRLHAVISAFKQAKKRWNSC